MRTLVLSLAIIFSIAFRVPPALRETARIDNLSLTLKEIFAKVKRYSVYRSRVNWRELENKILKDDQQDLSEAVFKQKVRLIFETIGDQHGAFYYKGERLGMDRSWTKRLRIPQNQPERVNLHTQRLAEGYGYLLVPSENRHDRQTCQNYQDVLCGLGPENLKGLVIDLRLQEGGSVYPLFVGLQQLYGTTSFGSNRDINGKVYQQWTSSYGGVQLKNLCKINPKLKIVVITSQITASAGEMMAVGLKGSPNTLFIGEPTAGFTTMNVNFNLGTYQLAIAASVIADRDGKIYPGSVLPDVTMVEGDYFKDLSKDKKVMAAIKWMKEK